MQITFNNKDFYDFYSRDRKISDINYKWNRIPNNLINTNSLPSCFSYDIYDKKKFRTYTVVGFMIHFCGRLIPVLFVSKTNDFYNREFYYKYEDIPEEITSFTSVENYSNLDKKIRDLFSISNHPWINIASNGSNLSKISLDDLHRKFKSPVFINGGLISCYDYINKETEITNAYIYGRINSYSVVTINPQLWRFNFIKCMDPFSTFIELEQYISNQLVDKDNKDIKISDKLKAESKGFDKWSFRKMKD